MYQSQIFNFCTQSRTIVFLILLYMYIHFAYLPFPLRFLKHNEFFEIIFFYDTFFLIVLLYRYFFFEGFVGYLSSLLDINIGVPQGSILGPILFLIYINHLSNCSNFKTTLYADDSVLALSHKNVNCLRTMLNFELPKVNVRLKSNQLSLNVNI